MAELADALDLGSSVNRRAGSTPVIRIKKGNHNRLPFSFRAIGQNVLIKTVFNPDK